MSGPIIFLFPLVHIHFMQQKRGVDSKHRICHHLKQKLNDLPKTSYFATGLQGHRQRLSFRLLPSFSALALWTEASTGWYRNGLVQLVIRALSACC